MATLVGAVDQGTSSTRFLVFSPTSNEVIACHQKELNQTFPKEGWVQMDPIELLDSVVECIEKTVAALIEKGYTTSDVKAIGITNQRETTVVWDRNTGLPLHDAIVWLDARTAQTVQELIDKTPTKTKEHFMQVCGLPISTYFSGVKMRWLLDHSTEVSEAERQHSLMFGTVDSWLLWNLTGGINGGVHVTDVTNASRTMLMNINTLKWDQEMCQFFGISPEILPKICSSSEVYGTMVSGVLKGVKFAGCLGDQQAALVGQRCFDKGDAKNTYGTGCFLLYNTGENAVFSTHGLLTTVGYQLGADSAPVYALEGSIAIAGACVRWLRDNLGIIKDSSDIEELAASVSDTGGVYFVPAFSGLFAPYWQSDARGVICGLTQYTTSAHIARAALEAVCFQTQEVLDAMNSDAGITLQTLLVDGGMTANELLMKLQADLTGIEVVKRSMAETTALGAAMAAGHAVGVWNISGVPKTCVDDKRYLPNISDEDREKRVRKWKDAVQRSMHWST